MAARKGGEKPVFFDTPFQTAKVEATFLFSALLYSAAVPFVAFSSQRSFEIVLEGGTLFL